MVTVEQRQMVYLLDQMSALMDLLWLLQYLLISLLPKVQVLSLQPLPQQHPQPQLQPQQQLPQPQQQLQPHWRQGNVTLGQIVKRMLVVLLTRSVESMSLGNWTQFVTASWNMLLTIPRQHQVSQELENAFTTGMSLVT